MNEYYATYRTAAANQAHTFLATTDAEAIEYIHNLFSSWNIVSVIDDNTGEDIYETYLATKNAKYESMCKFYSTSNGMMMGGVEMNSNLK